MNSRLVIYKASAGSGKTFTLAANYISHLLVNTEAYRHLLAVTFTNKATGEMKERILSQLYGISRKLEESDSYLDKAQELLREAGYTEDIHHQPLTEERLRDNAGKALTSILHNYSFFRIETIDTFMLGILRGLAKELELGQGMEIELDTNRVDREGVHDFIEQLQLDSKEMKAVIDYIQDAIDNERHWNVTNDLTRFAGNLHKEAFMRHADELDDRLKECPDTFIRLRRSLNERKARAERDIMAVADRFFDFCHSIDATIEDFNGIKNSPYSTFQKIKDGEKLTFKDITDSKKKYATGEKPWGNNRSRKRQTIDEHGDMLADLLRTLMTMLKEENTAQLVLNNLYQLQLVSGIDDRIKERLRRENRFLLADTCQMLRDMASGTGDTAFIYEKTGTEIDHIFIDEFQDTSGMQWANFRPLLKENASRGKQGLIVGDVKQAIYRFRNSDADIMARQVEADMQMAEPHTETLGVNRRSRERIVEFNNRFFPKLVEALGRKDAHFEVSHYADVKQEWLPKNKGGDVRMVEFSTQATPDEEGEAIQLTKEEAYSLAVAEQVKNLLDKGQKPTDIAILTRENKAIGTLAAWFEAHPEAFAPHVVRLVSGEAFKLESSDAVKMLVGAMRWVNNVDDVVSLAQVGIAWHRLVESDGLTVPDILALKERQYGLPEAFAAQHDELNALPLCELAHTLYDVLEMERMEGQAAWMQSFFDTVQQFASKKSASLDDFLKEWDETLSEKAIPSGDADGIACMTIHKAKGLEWDSVIVLGTNWKFEKSLTPPVLWVETKSDDYENLTVLPIKRGKDMQESDFAMQYDEETRQIWMDNLNLLYVAFTRPKSNLVILKEATKKNDQASEKKDSSIKEIGDFIELGLENVNDNENDNVNDNDNNAKLSMANCQLPIVNCPSMDVGFHTAPVRLPFRQSNSSRTYINRGDDSPMSEFIERGNLLHEVFAHIGKAEDAPQAIDNLFTQSIINATERDEIAHTVGEALRQPEVSEWFSGRYELFNECTILTVEDGVVVQKRPDRVMRSADKTIVVDFKFGEPAAKHHRQVGAYMSLLRQMGFENVEGYLWYVTQQNIVRV